MEFALLLFALVSQGAPELKGPDKIDPVTVAEFYVDVPESDARVFYRLYPRSVGQLRVYQGRAFVTGSAGKTYEIEADIAPFDRNAPSFQLIRQFTVNGGTPTPPGPGPDPNPPGPGPDPSPFPPGRFGMAQKAYDITLATVPATPQRAATAQRVAVATEGMAKEAAKGTYTGPAAFLMALKLANTSALGIEASSWVPWGKQQGQQLQLSESVLFSGTGAAQAQADWLNEWATGMKAVK